MATDAAVASMSLKQLLDGLLVSHREDIHAYGAGHLNESNLAKPPERGHRQSWPSAKKGTVPKTRSKMRRSQPTTKREDMTDTLAAFSLGTVGSLGVAKANQQKLSGNAPVTLERTDTVMVEELNAPELMLEKTQYHSGPPEAPEAAGAAMFGWSKDEALLPSKHSFVPGHQGAVTKKDAYDSMMTFQRDVVRKQDTTEMHVLTGVRAVQQLEDNLREDLSRLPGHQSGPNFHRLQVYSKSFDDLILNSATFGYMLGTIKDEYDEYVAALLDSQPGKHRTLHEHVDQLAAGGTSNPDLLAYEIQRVKEKEEEAKRLIEENERLRQQLAEEEGKSIPPEPEPTAPKQNVTVRHPTSSMDLVDHVEDLHSAIWQRLDEISSLKNDLRVNYEPSTVCHHLEQCIKETEVETQKLQSQGDYFGRSVSEMEEELKALIQEADTTDKDEKRVWTKIAAIKGSRPSEDEDDLNEEQKWSWYIS